MTNEEATKILRGIEILGGSLPEDGDLVEEALLMAIKALEQTHGRRCLNHINQMIEWSGAQKNTQGVYKGHITS